MSGPAADGAATRKIHAALQQRGVLPGTHIVDTGFLDAELLVESQDHCGVDLLRPITPIALMGTAPSLCGTLLSVVDSGSCE
jgi:hypothetical protein